MRKTIRTIILAVSMILVLSCTTLRPSASTPVIKTAEVSPSPTFTRTSIPPTAIVRPTATETPFPQDILDAQAFADPIIAALPGIPPLIEDDFSYNRGWIMDPLIEDQAIAGGMFHVTAFDDLYFLPPTYMYRRDFAMQVDIAAESNVPMGFFFRMYEDAYFHMLTIDPVHNTWRINLGCPGCRDQEGDLGFNIQMTDRPVTILLIVKGQQGAVYVNNLPAAYFIDPGQYQEGRLGLLFNGRSRDDVIPDGTFDNFVLWDLWGRP